MSYGSWYTDTDTNIGIRKVEKFQLIGLTVVSCTANYSKGNADANLNLVVLPHRKWLDL
jgi:hypothetical protein